MRALCGLLLTLSLFLTACAAAPETATTPTPEVETPTVAVTTPAAAETPTVEAATPTPEAEATPTEEAETPTAEATPTEEAETPTPEATPTGEAETPEVTGTPELETPEATGTPEVEGTPVATTEVIEFQPEVPEEEQEGSCFASSLTVVREGAYRCMVDSSILDPCFTAEDGETIICGADPITDEPGFQLALTEALPTPEPPVSTEGAAQAWIVRFADGVYCGFATGATGAVGEERINYLCSDESVIIGDLDTSGDVWMADRAMVESTNGAFTATERETLPIETVWR